MHSQSEAEQSRNKTPLSQKFLFFFYLILRSTRVLQTTIYIFFSSIWGFIGKMDTGHL